MYELVDDMLGVGGETPEFTPFEKCDMYIIGLTAGSIKLQYKLHKTEKYPNPVWVDLPDGEFTTDTVKTLYFDDYNVRLKAVGVANNTNVYVRFARRY